MLACCAMVRHQHPYQTAAKQTFPQPRSTAPLFRPAPSQPDSPHPRHRRLRMGIGPATPPWRARPLWRPLPRQLIELNAPACFRQPCRVLPQDRVGPQQRIQVRRQATLHHSVPANRRAVHGSSRIKARPTVGGPCHSSGAHSSCPGKLPPAPLVRHRKPLPAPSVRQPLRAAAGAPAGPRPRSGCSRLGALQPQLRPSRAAARCRSCPQASTPPFPAHNRRPAQPRLVLVGARRDRSES